uniref:probable E3 ubiquitin-protein ligase RHG1A n=1 Tax=Erigeron canadensis TaxID=72917 RepID=UPI001CB95596|nr:probable E3 ubiquitin-protein ligase RHG1A [Erigeron canadensis]
MGHRHLFNPHYMFETENDQSWTLPEIPYMQTVSSGAGESSSLIYPTDNMSIDGAQYGHCNQPPMNSGYPSLPHNMQIPNYQQHVAGPSDLSMHTYMAPEDYRNQASSSNFNGNPFNDEDLFDLWLGNRRVQSKRKSPGIPDGAGSSSDVTMLTQPWQETPTTNFLHPPWDYRAANSNGLSIGGESSLRNVRSRSAFDLETGTSRTNLGIGLPHEYYTTSHPMDVSPSINLLGQSSNSLNPTRMSSVGNDFESNPFLERSSNPSFSVAIGQQNYNTTTSSSHTSAQPVRSVRSNYAQRPGSTLRLSSSNLRLGDAPMTNEGLQMATSSHSSRHQRTSSTRARMSSERYISFPSRNFQGRAPTEGHMIRDQSAFYRPRNPFDQHHDMRLDIDGMSYEELLALGNHIGIVSTGIPEHLISKCLQESIYCSSDQIQEEGSCAICLEEYAHMDDIGMLRVCRHDFHVGCIRKWLSMKNLCPICKAEPMKQK